MATIAANVTQGLVMANATDADIQTYAETEVINWINDQYRSYRWDFARAETTAATTDGTAYVSLAADFWRINTAKIEDSDGNMTPLRVIPREEFDRLPDPTTEGTPYCCAVLGTLLYLYYVPDKSTYTARYSYWKTVTLTNASTAEFPDRIIEQVAMIAAMRYDNLDTIIEDAKLKKMVADFRRNMLDAGNDGAIINLEPNTHMQRPINYY